MRKRTDRGVVTRASQLLGTGTSSRVIPEKEGTPHRRQDSTLAFAGITDL